MPLTLRYSPCILSLLRSAVVTGLAVGALGVFVGCGQGGSAATPSEGTTTTNSVPSSTTTSTVATGPGTSQSSGATTPTSAAGVTSTGTPLTSTGLTPTTSNVTNTTTPEPASSSSGASEAEETSNVTSQPGQSSVSDDSETSSEPGADTTADETSDVGAYNPCPTEGPCVIMPYGDSITEGFPIWGGYRIELFSKAREDGHEVTFVGSVSNGPDTVAGVAFPKNHEGHGGFTIKDDPARNANGIFDFARPSLTNYKPHIVTLMVGTNDINGNIDTGSAPSRLGDLLDEVYDVAPNVLVVLAQIVPSRTDGTNQAIRTYNAAMPALAETQTAQGRHLILVDMYAAFTDNPDYKQAWLGDNLHPNEAGYARMAEVWYAVIEPFLR